MSKKKMPLQDPHLQREAQNYESPIVSREFILDFLAKRGAAATHPELCAELNLNTPEQIEALRRRLIAMCRDGQLLCNRRGAYVPVKAADLVAGRVAGHREGFGFLVPDDGSGDLFLDQRQMRAVFHGDRVLARVDGLDQRGRKEGVIVEVLESKTTQLVGRFFREGGIAFVVPENTRISQEVLVPEADCGGAKDGQYVTVEILRQPSFRGKPTGRIIEVLGEHMAPGMEIDVAIRAHDIPHIWPAAVEREAEKLPAEVSAAQSAGRLDLRAMPLVTIDGEDARDFDDAVFCEPLSRNRWRLVVAIADVATYVRPGTALDREANNRGTSVYFPDHVVPMLPEKLSNGLCSLNPSVDRLCMVCDMVVSSQGLLVSYQFSEAVMHSHARLTYTKVAQMLQSADSEAGQRLREQYAEVVPHLENLYRLYQVLRKARSQRGAIDFETTETRVIFTAERKIEEIVPVVRNDAHKIIEECMLMANVATALFLVAHKIPALYRVHEGPGAERLAGLRQFLGELALNLPGGDKPGPQDYQALLRQIKDRPDASVIQTVMLRSLSQAVYSPEIKGHFGLDYPHYAHFTSPIRRYPDLLVHRAIKSVIHGKKRTSTVVPPVTKDAQLAAYPYDLVQMTQLGEHCSLTERRADDATRDVMAWLKCEFLQQHVGATFDAVISAVTAFGFFAELAELFVDGLVHISSLGGDYYHFDAVRHRLIGERTAVSFRLGDKVQVRVARVNLEDRKIDLELVGTPVRQRRGEAADGHKAAKSSKAKAAPSGKAALSKKAASVSQAKKSKGKSAGKKAATKKPTVKKPTAKKN